MNMNLAHSIKINVAILKDTAFGEDQDSSKRDRGSLRRQIDKKFLSAGLFGTQPTDRWPESAN